MKQCFIIMPISDQDGYEIDHFKRVYDFIIKPACEAAGFKPVRANDVLNTNHIALDIVKKVIESDMAICDLSSRNPNVLYELGIRQAFNKPITLIKDSKTERIFDIQGFRDLEYDENLRYDNVESAVRTLTQLITNTYNDREHEVNSLVSLLGINAAEPKTVQISADTDIILKSINGLHDRLLEIERANKQSAASTTSSSSADNIPKGYQKLTQTDPINVGDMLWHTKYGSGKVAKLQGPINNQIISVDFGMHGVKKIMRSFAHLYKLSMTELLA